MERQGAIGDCAVGVVRNWLDLPHELKVVIFQKLGIVLMLTRAQLVCSLWRNIAKDPIFYRHILLGRVPFGSTLVPLVHAVKFARFVVDRSRGQLTSFACKVMMPFGKEDLHHIADSSTSSMKSLRIAFSPYINVPDLVQVVSKIPSLEDLHMCDFGFSKYAIEDIGRSCPKLKYLQLGYPFESLSDEVAYAIAENMTNLRSLRLRNSGLTGIGLHAIITGCPRLEYIFLSQYLNIDLECDFLKKRVGRLQNINFLRGELQKNEYEFHLKTGDVVSSIVCDNDLDFSDDDLQAVYFDHTSYTTYR